MTSSAKVGAALLLLLAPQVPPSIREEGRMTNVSGLAGQPLTLECDANGFPVPEVVWLKDGHLVGISGEVGMGGFCVCSGGIGRWQRDVTCLWGCPGSGAGGELDSGHHSSTGLCSLLAHTPSLWTLVLRSQRQVTITSWMVPAPSTSPGSRRVIPASISAGLRTRPGAPRGTSVLLCSVSEDHDPHSQTCVRGQQGSQRGHHRPRTSS